MQLLDSDGFRAHDAEDLLAYARSHPVPLAVLDVWMPKTSGLELQAQLRVVSPKTKVIVITAREIPAIRAAALEGGAFAFLMKPFEDEVFLSLVHSSTLPRGVSAAQALGKHRTRDRGPSQEDP